MAPLKTLFLPTNLEKFIKAKSVSNYSSNSLQRTKGHLAKDKKKHLSKIFYRRIYLLTIANRLRLLLSLTSIIL